MLDWSALSKFGLTARLTGLSIGCGAFAGLAAYGALAVAAPNAASPANVAMCAGIAVTAFIMAYVAIRIVLVRPAERLAEAIARLHADPEAVPIPPSTDLLAALHRDLRAASWRSARLAALAAVVSRANHDLRGALSPILLSGERLEAHADPAVSRMGEMLMRAADRATTILRETVECARQTWEMPKPERVALRPLLVEAAALALGGGLDLVGVAENLEIDADPASLRRVLVNLLRNAFAAGAIRVSVNAVTEPGAVRIEIADDGPGLPAMARAQLFEPPVGRAESGYGLAIVRDLLRVEGGHIALASTSSAGTTFVITLPTKGRKSTPA